MADNFTVTRIPQLAELLQKEGTLYVPVYKVNDDSTYRILVDLLGGATDTTLQWNSQDNYNNGEIREWDLKLWKSKITDGVTENIGNIPAENEFWTEVSKAEGAEGLSNYSTGVYTVDPSLVIQNKALFLLDTSKVTMPYQSTDFTAELNAGVWIKLSNNFVRDAVNQSLSPSTLGDKLDMNGGGILNYRSRELNLSGSNDISITAQGGDTYKQSNPGFGLSDTLIIPDATLTGNYGRKLSFYLNGSSGAGGQLVISTETGQLIGGESSQTIGIDNTGFTVLESNGEWLIIQDSRPKPSLSSLIIYATLANVTDPASYFKLVISLNDPDYSQTEQLTIGPTVTDDGVPVFQGAWTFENDIIQGVIPATNSTARLKLRQASGTADIIAYYEIYKRDAGGTETLINTSPDSPILSETQEVYELTAFIPEQNLEPGDRLVWKFYGQKVGGTAVSVGTIEFTTGGLNQPAEITFPVPGTSLSIEHGDTTNRNLPNQHNTESVQQDTDLLNYGIEAPETLNNVLLAINNKKLWGPELIPAATTEHPRWDDSLDANIYGTDKFRFGALPAGTRNSNPNYAGIGEFFGIWSKDKSQFYIDFDSGDSALFDFTGSETNGMSLRLVRAYAPADGTKTDGRILPGTFTDGDGNTYDGVIIGNQVWSTTNLKATFYADGTTAIPTGYSDVDWSNLTTGAYAVYPFASVAGIDSEAEMIAAYGLLYNWYAVDNVLGLATNGSVPTDAEFTELTNYIIANYPEIDSTNIGDALKSIRQVNSPFEAESDIYIKPKDNELTSQQRYAGTEYLRQKTALPNIETSVEEEVSTIFSNIDSRLFEQIAFALTGYDEDITLNSQDITLSPYTFTAQKLAVHIDTAPTGSNAVVTFYHNGVSIGTVTITAGTTTGSTLIADVSVSENDTMSAVVTAVGTTIAGATAKAYIQGIKTQ